MLQSTCRSALALGIMISIPAMASEPQDQGPVILGMDDWVDDGSMDIEGPFSGVTVAEQETNDTAATANPIELGDNYTGTIVTGAEFDYASFVVNAGDGVLFETISGVGSLADTTLSLVDIDGTTELMFDDDGGVGRFSKIEYYFPVAGTYYIKTGSWSNLIGDYLLEVRLVVAPTPADGWAYIQRALEAMAPAVFVSNDGSVAVVGSLDSAATSRDAGAAYHHSVPAAAENAPALTGQVTFYSGVIEIDAFFTDLAQGNVRPAIVVFPGTGAPNSLDVGEGAMLVTHADKIGDFIAAGGGLLSHGDEASGNVAYDWVPAVFPGMEIVYSSNTPSFSDEGSFSLPGMEPGFIDSGAHGHFLNHGMSVFVEAPGEPVLGPFSGVTVPEQEPNDEHFTADLFGLGDDYIGDITAGSDFDYVAFAAFTGAQIVAETVSGGSLADTTLALYSTDGVTRLAYDDDGGAGTLSKIEYTLGLAGTYYLRVGGNGGFTGSYHLELRELVPSIPLAVVVGVLPGPWIWLGNALFGLHGKPLLTGAGELSAGSAFSLDLTRARQNSSALMILGFWHQNLPFKGGLMVPNPGLLVPLLTDNTGALTISGAVAPGSPTGATVFLQYWIRDSFGPRGYSASNGLSLTTQ